MKSKKKTSKLISAHTYAMGTGTVCTSIFNIGPIPALSLSKLEKPDKHFPLGETLPIGTKIKEDSTTHLLFNGTAPIDNLINRLKELKKLMVILDSIMGKSSKNATTNNSNGYTLDFKQVPGESESPGMQHKRKNKRSGSGGKSKQTIKRSRYY